MSEPSAPRVLLLIAHFLPGVRFGGPVRTVANMLERLGGSFRFHVLTRNCDFQSQVPYRLESNRWLDWHDHAQVYYADDDHVTPQALARLGRELCPDVVYLNSFFHPRFSLLPYQLWRNNAFGPAGLVIAPRGEFAQDAVKQKAWKKRPLILAQRMLRRYREVLWQASSPFEAADIHKVMGQSADVHVAPDLAAAPIQWLPERLRRKQAGDLRVLFLGRISRMKNLLFLMDCLDGLQGRVELTLAGPAEDSAY
jgi:glycosyltransferase involved in cell wall biosynthesis